MPTMALPVWGPTLSLTMASASRYGHMQTQREVLPFVAPSKQAVLARNPPSLMLHPESKPSALMWALQTVHRILVLKLAKAQRGAPGALGVRTAKQMVKLKPMEP